VASSPIPIAASISVAINWKLDWFPLCGVDVRAGFDRGAAAWGLLDAECCLGFEAAP
jgi:hypothetical protein